MNVTQSAATYTLRGLGRAMLACAALLLLWPAAAEAQTGRCLEVEDLAERGMAAFMKPPADSSVPASVEEEPTVTDVDAPCSEDVDDTDPSSNQCFEDAGEPISTLPRLLAQWRAQKTAAGVVDSVVRWAERGPSPVVVAELPAAPASEPIDLDADSCGEDPAECRSLPPLPPTVVVDASAPAARQLDSLLAFPSVLTAELDVRPWAKLRVRASLGHRDPPQRPPAVIS